MLVSETDQSVRATSWPVNELQQYNTGTTFSREVWEESPVVFRKDSA